MLFLLNPPKQETTPQTIYSRLISIDWIGICLSIPAVVCFLAALQIGSAWEGWSSWKPCVLFAVSAVLLAAFLFSQWRLRDKAMLPFRLVRQRVVICSMACSALIDGFYYVLIYNVSLSLATVVEWLDGLLIVLAVASLVPSSPRAQSRTICASHSSFHNTRNCFNIRVRGDSWQG